MKQAIIDKLNTLTDLNESLQLICSETKGKIVFSTSFGIEDQVISDVIFKNDLTVEVFTLDTGRFFQETYNTWDKTLMKYRKSIKPFYPEHTRIESFVEKNGINAFYESPELRKECCAIRKVEPLKRALKDASIWITGLRAEQSPNRNSTAIIEWDEAHQLYKFNPLLYWTFEQVKNYTTQNRLPYNPLHDKGFVSIGCAPCTRAIKTGEDFRAGRWWWEDQSKKECGLHRH